MDGGEVNSSGKGNLAIALTIVGIVLTIVILAVIITQVITGQYPLYLPS